MKLNILAIGVHPDDVELGCSGTLIRHKEMGLKVGVLDLTRGELGTRGNADLRDQEAAKAAELLNLDFRENTGFADGFFVNDKHHQLEIIKILRRCQPDIVLTNALHDRHPDHGRAAKLTSDACFLSGLKKVETAFDGSTQQEWRPKAVYNYIQALYAQPQFIVDISEQMNRKMEAVKAYKSQFYDPNSDEPETYISRPEFMEAIRSRCRFWGDMIGVAYGEGFTYDRHLGISDLRHFI